MRDLEHELDDLGNEEHPPAWRGEVGDVVVGRFFRYERAVTRHGLRFIAVAKDEETQEFVSIWLNWKVLQERFKELRPQPGERFGVRRLPDHAKGYRRFSMLVDREDSNEPDFFRTEDVQDAPDASADLTDDDVPF
jgi:hypothetical protein